MPSIICKACWACRYAQAKEGLAYCAACQVWMLCRRLMHRSTWDRHKRAASSLPKSFIKCSLAFLRWRKWAERRLRVFGRNDRGDKIRKVIHGWLRCQVEKQGPIWVASVRLHAIVLLSAPQTTAHRANAFHRAVLGCR
jgi:hypothetical protein